MTKIHCGYVVSESGTIYAQAPHSGKWGFAIFDDDQTWDGGIGIGSWEPIDDDDPRITDADRERLGWILEQERGRS